jgi:hypothetical protein
MSRTLRYFQASQKTALPDYLRILPAPLPPRLRRIVRDAYAYAWCMPLRGHGRSFTRPPAC